jgi:hypothetical protein
LGLEKSTYYSAHDIIFLINVEFGGILFQGIVFVTLSYTPSVGGCSGNAYLQHLRHPEGYQCWPHMDYGFNQIA